MEKSGILEREYSLKGKLKRQFVECSSVGAEIERVGHRPSGAVRQGQGVYNGVCFLLCDREELPSDVRSRDWNAVAAEARSSSSRMSRGRRQRDDRPLIPCGQNVVVRDGGDAFLCRSNSSP